MPAWVGASWATRLNSATLHKVLAACLLLAIAVVLLVGHGGGASSALIPVGPLKVIVGVIVGFAIGDADRICPLQPRSEVRRHWPQHASNAHERGDDGELLIPTIILLYGLDKIFAAVMVLGSIVGSFVGARLLDIVPEWLLLPFLALVLIASAVKVWRR